MFSSDEVLASIDESAFVNRMSMSGGNVTVLLNLCLIIVILTLISRNKEKFVDDFGVGYLYNKGTCTFNMKAHVIYI